MAPEVIRGGAADQRSDLFALGLTIRYALTGADAVSESTLVGLMLAMVSEPISLPDVPLSESFATFLGWLVALEPSSRPSTASAALRAVEAMEISRVVPRRPRAPRVARSA